MIVDGDVRHRPARFDLGAHRLNLRRLLFVQNRLWCGLAQFNLRGHFLQASGKRFNLLLVLRKFPLLLRVTRFQFLNLAMGFEKLIE